MHLGRIAKWWERGEIDSLQAAEDMIRDVVIEMDAEMGGLGVRVWYSEVEDSWRADILHDGVSFASETMSVFPKAQAESPIGPADIDKSIVALCAAADRVGWTVTKYEHSTDEDGLVVLSIEAHAKRAKRQGGK